MRYHRTTIRMAKVWSTDNIKCWQGCRGMRTLTDCWWEHKMGQTLWKRVWQFLTTLNKLFSYNPAIMLLGIYPKKAKTYIHPNLHIDVYSIFILSIFIHNCQNWEAIRIPLGNWVNKPTLVHPSIHPKEHYSALKSNEQSSHEEDMEETWMHTARVHAKSLQSCLTLCDPMGYSPPGSSVHGILQARILEWVVMPSSKGSS